MGWWDTVTSPAKAIGHVYAEAGRGIYSGAGAVKDNLTGKTSADASKAAAKTQADAGNKALGFEQQVRDQNISALKPYLDRGTQDYNTLSSMVNGGQFNTPDFKPGNYGTFQAPTPGYVDKGFSLADLAKDPGYQFRLQQGLNTVQNSAAARHSIHGGNEITGLENYAQGFASNEGNNAYNRYATDRSAGIAQNNNDRNFALDQFNGNRSFNAGQDLNAYNSSVTNQQNRFNRLSQLAGYGQQAAGSLAGINQNFAQNAGNIQMGIGNAQAAGQVGAANASTQGTQNLLGLGAAYLGGR